MDDLVTFNPPDITATFHGAVRTPALPRENEMLMILANINKFLESVEQYKTEDQANTPEAEQDLKNKFMTFLSACQFYPALQDFQDLLEFKSGKNAKRSDGTINWYHEFLPIVNDLSLIRAGKKKWWYGSGGSGKRRRPACVDFNQNQSRYD